MDTEVRSLVENLLGHRFAREELLEQALTHASVAPSRLESNERLEFLGDSVLGLVACDLIYSTYPTFLEGEMTKIKSAVVSRATCSAIASSLGLDRVLLLGKGMQNGELPSSLGAAALEAVIGALFIDAGYEAAARFLKPLILPHIESVASNGHQQNFKSVLQQHCQQGLGVTPGYRILDEQGPDHAKCFRIGVEVGGRKFESAWGQSKKKAEQTAALNALRELGVIEEMPGGGLRVAEAYAAPAK